jgi:iron complex transport system substrate-binding protein
VRGRLTFALVGAVLAGVAPAGCSEATGEGEDEGKSPTLQVAHAQGNARVPGRAKRVVALTPDSLDTAVALGLVPVGAATSADGALPSYLGAVRRGISPVGPAFALDVPAIRRLEPDVIVGSKRRQGTRYGTLKRIAPTVMSEDTGHSWEVNTRLGGEAFGRTDEAESLLSRYDRRVARLRRALAEGRRPEVSMVRVLPDGVRATGSRSFAGTILGDAGLPRPRPQRAEKASVAPSRDLSALDGDVILLSSPGDGLPRLRALTSSAAWRGLGAVRAGRVHRVADDVWGGGGGVLAAEVALRDLRRLLLG